MFYVIVLAVIIYVVYRIFKTTRDWVEASFGSLLSSMLIVLISVVVGAGLFGLVSITTHSTPERIDKGGWNIKAMNPAQETHHGSKRRVYTTSNFHVLVARNDGMYQVVSFPMDQCVIKESDENPHIEQIDTVKRSKLAKFLFICDVVDTHTVYEFNIPKGNILENYLVM